MEVFKPNLHTRISMCAVHGEYEERGIALNLAGERIIWMGCAACNAAQRAAEQAQQAALEERARQCRMERRLQIAGIPLRFRTRQFDDYVADTPDKQHALKVAQDFAEQFSVHAKRGTFVVFSGRPGTGKSHLALAIAQHVMRNGTAMYITAMDLIRRVRDTWRRDSEDSESQVLDLFSALDLLVLDEVGAQYGTEGEQVILFDVLNRRYRDMRPTILLTNLSKAGMKPFLGERSFDRLREDGIWVPFDWESYRGTKRAA